MYQLATGYLGPVAYAMAKKFEQILETKLKTHGDFIDWLQTFNKCEYLYLVI